MLLDADQDPGPELLRYHMKWRFWFQEYTPPTTGVAAVAASHADLPRFYYQTEGWAGEYDIPPAFRTAADPPIVGYPGWPASSVGDMHPTPGSTCIGSCPDGPDCECEHKVPHHDRTADLLAARCSPLLLPPAVTAACRHRRLPSPPLAVIAAC